VSSRVLRALNDAGIERFRAYLAALRGGAAGEPPRDLLADPHCTEELAVDVLLEEVRFTARWIAAQYLFEKLSALPPESVEGNRGLWSWLALHYFDQLSPRRPDGSRKPGRDYRHIPDFGYRYRHRHLLYGPYAVYRRHRAHSVLVLSGPVHREQSLYHEIASRQDLIASRGVLEAMNLLYLDKPRGMPRRGAQSLDGHPGTVRRFVRVLQQLDLTYDISGMSGKAIVDLLPPEFDEWRRKA